MADSFAAKLKTAQLVTKVDIADFVIKTNFDKKLINLCKTLLQIKQNIYWLKIN